MIQHLLVLIILAGCTSSIAESRTVAKPVPTRSANSAARDPVSSATDESPVSFGTLVSVQIEEPPVVDGREDAMWGSAVPLQVALTWGRTGIEHAYDLELSSLHDESTVYFLARWPGSPPDDPENTARNKLTAHFDIPEPYPGARDFTCLVACHTAFADERGRIIHMSAETIPPGRTDSLPAAGQSSDGWWQLEWSRPLVQINAFDLQFTDLDATYTFFIKVFEGQDGRADPVSGDLRLVFER